MNSSLQAGTLPYIQSLTNALGAEDLDLKVALHGDSVALLVFPDVVTASSHSRAIWLWTASRRIEIKKSPPRAVFRQTSRRNRRPVRARDNRLWQRQRVRYRVSSRERAETIVYVRTDGKYSVSWVM